MAFAPLSQREEAVAKEIVQAAFNVHSRLGPGLLERVYELCFCHELAMKDIRCERQVEVPIAYDDLFIQDGLRLDILVDNLVICELKAVDDANPLWEAQLLTYLKLSGKRLGFLINFNVPTIKNGIRRMIL
jgi:GxxExxY protein